MLKQSAARGIDQLVALEQLKMVTQESSTMLAIRVLRSSTGGVRSMPLFKNADVVRHRLLVYIREHVQLVDQEEVQAAAGRDWAVDLAGRTSRRSGPT